MTARKTLTLFAGVVSATLVVLLLALAAFLAVSGAGMREPTLFVVISVFPLLIAVACLCPSRRTVALRLVGGITSLVIAGILIAAFVSPEIELNRRQRAIYVAVIVGAAAIAVKGRWPSATKPVA